ncbi:MAG: hypothetical protein SO287_01190 [Parabacteroides sp.]|nr:hypothetical protein [Parabacteroides sp.]MDD6078908.1 hypothetical protein [bacterium]MCI7007440.1 hypothetical protein [Parabacteroides sp.]MCI7783570.1 hypothetical protein [Parabacteroides sp.]MDD7063382.1 hypothetical protein [bacterium]
MRRLSKTKFIRFNASSSTSWLFALNEGVNVPMPSICTGWPSWMKVFIA